MYSPKLARACAVCVMPWLLLSSACSGDIDMDIESPGSLEQNFVLEGRKWSNRNLSYFFFNGTSDIAGTDEHRLVRDAMKLWSLESPLTFTEKGSEAGTDIVIKWATGEHGDGIPFSPGGSLAHAEPPPPGVGTRPGDLHFNDAFVWTAGVRNTSASPYDLGTVATHELMHSLGLAHAATGDFYTGSQRFIVADDIDGIQQLYGSAKPLSIRPIGTGVPSVFVRGPDNSLWENTWTGSKWVWTDHGGSHGSSPSTVVYQGTPYVFTRLSNGNLGVRYGGSPWVSGNLGGSIAGAPEAITWGTGNSNLSVFARGVDNALWEYRYSGTSWTVIPHGDNILTTAAPMVTGSNTLAVFVLRADRSLAARWFNGSSWAWESHGGDLTSAPVALGVGSDLKVFARGADDALWERYWNGSAWIWSTHNGAIRGIPTVVSPTNVFVRGSDDMLWQNWWNGSSWVWTSHGGSCTSSPSAISVLGTQRVFVRSSTGSIAERYWTGSQWLWRDHGSSVLLP